MNEETYDIVKALLLNNIHDLKIELKQSASEIESIREKIRVNEKSLKNLDITYSQCVTDKQDEQLNTRVDAGDLNDN